MDYKKWELKEKRGKKWVDLRQEQNTNQEYKRGLRQPC